VAETSFHAPVCVCALTKFVSSCPICLPLVDTDVKPAAAAAVAVTPSKAKQFLASLKRSKRNLWDRSRPDVQQWIQQFMYMGFDEAVSTCVSF